MAPAVPRAPWASPPAIPVAGSGFAPFLMSERRPTEGHLHRRAKTVVSHAQSGSREVPGRKGAVQGSRMDPLDGPIADLVEGDTFFRTPLFGYGAIDPPGP